MITLQFLINFQYLYLVVPVSYTGNCFNKEVGNDVINSEGGRMTNKHTFLLSNSSRKSRILVGGSSLLMDKKKIIVDSLTFLNWVVVLFWFASIK